MAHASWVGTGVLLLAHMMSSTIHSCGSHLWKSLHAGAPDRKFTTRVLNLVLTSTSTAVYTRMSTAVANTRVLKISNIVDLYMDLSYALVYCRLDEK